MIFLLAPGWLLSLGTERHLSMGHKMWFGRLGVTNPRALKWGSNKAFNDTLTLLLESCVDQLMKNCICFVHFSQRLQRKKRLQKNSHQAMDQVTLLIHHIPVTKDTETGRHSLTRPSYLFHEFTPIQQTAVEIIYPLLKFTGLYHVFIHPHLMSSTILHWISELAGITLLGKYH